MGEYVWMCDRVYCLLSSCLAHTQPKALRVFFVYYESIKREPKIRGINKCRCDERLCVVVYCKSKARAKDYKLKQRNLRASQRVLQLHILQCTNLSNRIFNASHPKGFLSIASQVENTLVHIENTC
jgi:hypothetical protein